MGNWQPALPVSGTKMVDFPAIATGNWDHLEDVINVEHYAMDSSLSGQHRPGKVAAVYVGPTASIGGLTSPTTGALAYDTDLGHYKWYNGNTWENLSDRFKYSAVSVYCSSDQTLSYATVCTAALTNEEFDVLSEWDGTYGHRSMQISASGFYLISATFLCQFPSNTSVSAAVNVVGSDGSAVVEVVNAEQVKSGDPYPVNIFSTNFLGHGNIIHFWIYNDSDEDGLLVGADGTNKLRSFAYIYRLS